MLTFYAILTIIFNMNNIENLKSIIAKNLTYYRKKAGITQQELADKLSYSDKSISKWERGEGVPDIYILKQIADLYEITVNDLIGDKSDKPAIVNNLKNKIIICLLSIGLVWLVATIIHSILQVILINSNSENHIIYVYYYALPCSFIILYIFNRIWFKKKVISGISVSLIFWTTVFSFYWTIKDFFDNFEVFFFIGIPFQILVILWYLMEKKKIK